MKRKFEVNFQLDGWDISSGIIELDQCVIDAVDDTWRRTIIPSIRTPDQIAAFIAYNMIVNDCHLSAIDGFANQLNENAVIIKWPMGLDDFYVYGKEIVDAAGNG